MATYKTKYGTRVQVASYIEAVDAEALIELAHDNRETVSKWIERAIRAQIRREQQQQQKRKGSK